MNKSKNKKIAVIVLLTIISIVLSIAITIIQMIMGFSVSFGGASGGPTSPMGIFILFGVSLIPTLSIILTSLLLPQIPNPIVVGLGIAIVVNSLIIFLLLFAVKRFIFKKF